VIQQPIQPVIQQPIQPVIQQPIQPVIQQPVIQPQIQQPVQPQIQPIQPVIQQPIQPVQQPIQQPIEKNLQQPTKSDEIFNRGRSLITDQELGNMFNIINRISKTDKSARENLINDMKGKINIKGKEIIGDESKLFETHYFGGDNLSFFTALTGTRITIGKWLDMDEKIRSIMNAESETVISAATATLVSYLTNRLLIMAVKLDLTRFVVMFIIPKNPIGEICSMYKTNVWYGMKYKEGISKLIDMEKMKGFHDVEIEHISKTEVGGTK
jgi:hypothetical protein